MSKFTDELNEEVARRLRKNLGLVSSKQQLVGVPEESPRNDAPTPEAMLREAQLAEKRARMELDAARAWAAVRKMQGEIKEAGLEERAVVIVRHEKNPVALLVDASGLLAVRKRWPHSAVEPVRLWPNERGAGDLGDVLLLSNIHVDRHFKEHVGLTSLADFAALEKHMRERYGGHDDLSVCYPEPVPVYRATKNRSSDAEINVQVKFPDVIKTVPAETETVPERGPDGYIERSVTRPTGG